MELINNFALENRFPEILSSFLKSKILGKKAILFLIFLSLTHFSFSQNSDSTKLVSHFSDAVSVTNKGISTIPSFTLGKPAVIFDLSIGKGNLRFEPQLRFALEGKPWSFLFWWRYKILENDKLLIKMGAHPALSFKTVTYSTNGVSNEAIVARRYLAGELSPNYFLTKNISIGLYYLYAYGVEKDVTKHTHFLALRSNFSKIKLSNQYFIGFTPQLYYLKMDRQDGFYFTSRFTLAKKNFPISISAIINKTIQTNISASNDFIWNASLIYSFNKKYIEL